ncbi:MAG: peptidylprolyl isomerase [Clostridia bacterium]|nr:peptidylprolyl isomerase [Clostridia bacterium]
MGKKKSVNNYANFKKQQQTLIAKQEQSEAEKKQRKTVAAIAGGVTAVLLALIITVTSLVSASGSAMRGRVALSSGDRKIDNAMLAYFFYSNLNDCLNMYHGSEVNVNKSLKNQEFEPGTSWYDYVMSITLSQTEELLTLACGADAEGITLSDSDVAGIDKYFESLQQAADSQKMSLDKFISKSVCKGIKAGDVRKCLELSTLAEKYYETLCSRFNYTEAQLNDYLQKNYNDFLCVDYKINTFLYNIPSDATEEEAGEIKEKNLNLAKELAACKTLAEFDNYLREYLSDLNASEETVNQTISDTLIEGYEYETEYDLGKWAFTQAKAVGETMILEGQNQYSVYMLAKTPYIRTDNTKNIRHILLTPDSYGSDEAAFELAKRLKEYWQSGEATAESFAALATVYSEDPGSKSQGGLYANMEKDVMVTEFNDWCYDAARKPGDCDIVKTAYGYHIMYFQSQGMPYWQAKAREILFETDYDAAFEELKQAHPIVEDDTFTVRDKK